MFRQFVCPVVVVLIALAGIGGFLMTSEHSRNAVAEKEVTVEPVSQVEPGSVVKEREQRLTDINLILASRVPQISERGLKQTQIEQTPWLDPALDSLYQQIRNQQLAIRFPRGDEKFAIWVGNPESIVDGKKVFQHTEALKKSVPLINQLPFPVKIWFYGTRDQSNPELGECIEVLSAIPNVNAVKFSYCRINERGFAALQNLPKLTDLEILYSNLDDAGLEQITQIKNLHRVSINLRKKKVSASALEKITELPDLEDLKLIVSLEPDEITSFWEKLTGCTKLVSVDVHCGGMTQEMMIHFLEEGDRQKLRSWKIYSECPGKALANALSLAPNLEVLKASSGKAAEIIYLLEQAAKHHPRMRTLAIGWESGVHLQGDQTRQALSLLACFPNLEHVHVPMILPEPKALQPLTRLSQLQYFYCKNLNLNQETLLQLAQMPSLKKLQVDSLELGRESAHLLPWLTNVERIEINDPTTLTDERLTLLATMPRLTKLKWCDIAIKEPVPLSEEARSAFQHIRFDVCEK
tara:strand:- start:38359 stop:39927 length:1569 start_codon:yes stop_codon:yes gene_type:complete